MWNAPLDKKQSSDQPDLEAAFDEAIAANAASRPASASSGPSLKVSPGIAPRGGMLGTLQTREGQLGALSMALLIFQVPFLILLNSAKVKSTSENWLAEPGIPEAYSYSNWPSRGLLCGTADATG